jgi:uncharacterized protein (DUF58 family)
VPRLTGRGLIALVAAPVSGIAGLLVGAEELVLLALALAAVLIVGVLQCAQRAARAKGRWRLTARLALSDVPRGEPSTLSVTAHASGGAGRVAVWLEDPSGSWEEAAASTPPRRSRAPAVPEAVLLPALGDSGSAELRFPAPTERRGVYRMPGARLWCFDSLALFAALIAASASATMTVLPTTVPVRLTPEQLQADGANDESTLVTVHAPRRQHNLGDFAGLRPYVPGDRLRLLYWPALARTGELLVRDFEDTSHHILHVLADVRSHLGTRGAERVLSTAAGVGLAALASGAIVEFSTTAGDEVAIGPGPLSDLALLRAIAAVHVASPPSRRRGRTTAYDPSMTPALLTRAGLVVTTAGGANSMPAVLRAHQVVLAQ